MAVLLNIRPPASCKKERNVDVNLYGSSGVD